MTDVHAWPQGFCSDSATYNPGDMPMEFDVLGRGVETLETMGVTGPYRVRLSTRQLLQLRSGALSLDAKCLDAWDCSLEVSTSLAETTNAHGVTVTVAEMTGSDPERGTYFIHTS